MERLDREVRSLFSVCHRIDKTAAEVSYFTFLEAGNHYPSSERPGLKRVSLSGFLMPDGCKRLEISGFLFERSKFWPKKCKFWPFFGRFPQNYRAKSVDFKMIFTLFSYLCSDIRSVLLYRY